MKKIPFLLTIIICGVLQSSWLFAFKLFNVKPDLLLICVVVASLAFNWKWALFFGIFSGLFKDAFCLTNFGINTFLFASWSIIISRLSREITIESDLMRMVLVFIIVILQDVAHWAILIYLGIGVPTGIFLRTASIDSIYTALLLLLMFKVIKPVILEA